MITGINEGNTKPFTGKAIEQNPSRRLVLRGSFALGCGLLLPAALLGCDSKKDENSTGAAPADAPDTSADAAPPASSPDAGADATAPAAAKVSQASVQYQAQPKGDQKCDNCMHFIADSNTCKLVEGEISPEGWCSLWVKKT